MKKVLIITYYWPPAGGPGVQRWLKFVKYLPEFNIEPIVYIPENPNYPLVDESLLSEVPQGISIIKQPIKEPYKLAGIFSKKSKTISKGIIAKKKKQGLAERLLLYIRGNFFIPDARKSWVKPSVEFLNDYLLENPVDTIITTGPPHSLHLIGLHLKEKLNIKWFADFRDPWTTIGYHKQLKLSESSKQKHKELEQQVLQSADQVIVTTPVTKREFQSLTTQPIEVITNGYDVESHEVVTLDEKFTVSHIGSLLSERNPEILWKALRELISEHTDFANDFQLNLVGAISEEILQTAESYGLDNYINKVGYVSHAASIIYQKQSQVLLLVEINSEDTKCIIPGKLFEYMVSNRPVIAVGPEGSDIEQIIKETNTGHYFNYQDYDALKQLIFTHYKAYKGNNLRSNPIGLQKYSRRSLTNQLAQLILK